MSKVTEDLAILWVNSQAYTLPKMENVPELLSGWKTAEKVRQWSPVEHIILKPLTT